MESHALIAHILILRNSTLITQCARMFWTFERIFQRKVERQSKYVAGNNTFLTSANNSDLYRVFDGLHLHKNPL